ncbi:MAG: GspE/PulE family protein [Gammaproteobacteria bacterium]|nr:MAG: GspE/PulE family protein [Gammaproteobacteria bacterium]
MIRQITATDNSKDSELDLRNLVTSMTADRLLSRKDADQVLADVRPKDLKEKHPIQFIGDFNFKSANGSHNILSEEALCEWLAEKAGLEYRRIDPLKIDVSAITGTMSFSYASRLKILPLEVHDDSIVIATAQPYMCAWMPDLAHILQKDVVRVISAPSDIDRYTLEFFSLSRSVDGAEGQDMQTPSGISNLEQLVKLGEAGQLDVNDQHIVHVVDWLLQYAFDQRASDIHLEPRRDTSNIRFRIDGILHLVYEIPTAVMSAVTSRLKAIGRMDVVERRRPLDGRLKTKTPRGREVELRLSTLPTVFGEKMVIRIFDPDVLVKSFHEMGLSDDTVAAWEELAEQPHGIILVTGPTGTGKTTTLYSTLKHLAKPEVNVCTIEDPIEMVEPTFNQMQVQPSINLTFADGVRALLRQDPDIIMVGEIRDIDTAEMSVQAALTGHLVFSTLHTNSAAAAITRLLEIGVASYLLKATLLGVVAQRLLRTLCPHCKEKGPLDDELWKTLVGTWNIPQPKEVFHPKGCLDCRNTGYLGRIGLYELLKVTPEITHLISSDVEAATISQQAQKQGMQPLVISGVHKVAAGLTTVEEVLRVAGAYH